MAEQSGLAKLGGRTSSTGSNGSTGRGLVQALIYTRVSSDEQAHEGLSLPAQLAACRRYVAERRWAIAGEYQDVLSGTRDDRPAYQQLLAEARRLAASGQLVVVVVARLDRFGRKVLERVRSREEFKALGVALHSALEGGEVSDLVANVLAAVAQEEVRQLGQRVRTSIAHVAANGWHPVGRSPWGYRWRPATAAERAQGAPHQVLEPDPVAAKAVIGAFKRVAASGNVREVARWVGQLPNEARGGRLLGYAAVAKALRARVYLAQQPDGRPGRWPPLVTPELWEQVQARIASHRRHPHQASGNHLLTGYIWCARCGARMAGWVDTVRKPARAENAALDSRRRTYFCEDKVINPSRRCGYTVPARTVEALVLRAMADALAPLQLASRDDRLHTHLVRAWDDLRRPAWATAVEGEVRRLEAQRRRAQDRLRKAALALVDERLDQAGYRLVRETVERELDAINRRLAELEQAGQYAAPVPNLPPLDEALAAVGGWQGALACGDTAARRELLAVLLERVVPVRIGRGEYELRVNWTPLGNALNKVAERLAARLGNVGQGQPAASSQQPAASQQPASRGQPAVNVPR